MDKQLSPETKSQIRVLCESIAQRDQLGEDVQEELRGHIEDKVMAYLEGREALTELDAVVLAREHFGSSSTLKSYLNSLEPHRLNADVVRKLSQLVLVSYSIQIIAVLLLRAFLNGNPLAAFGINSKPSTLTPELMVATSGLIVISIACVLGALRNVAALRKFEQVSTRTTALSATAAFVLCACMPTWWRSEHTPQTGALAALFVLHILLSIISSYTWLWWVDQSRGRLAHIAAAACVWLAAILLHPIAARTARFGERIVFGEAYMDVYAGTYSSFTIHPITTFQFGLNASGLSILYLVLACVAYGAFVRRGRAARGDIALAN